MKLLNRKSDNSKPKKIQIQMFRMIIAIVVLAALAILIANSQLLPIFYLITQQKTLTKAFYRVDSTINSSLSFNEDMVTIQDTYGIEAEIYSNDGALVYSTAVNDFLDQWIQGYSGDIFEEVKTKKLTTISHKDNTDGSYFEVQQEYGRNAQYLVYVNVAESGNTVKLLLPINYMEQTANSTTAFVSIVACVAFIVVTISVMLYLRRLTKPLLEINNITRDMSKMNFSRKCQPYENNEIGQLGQSINVLSNSLDETLKALQEKNARLEEDIEHERMLEHMRREFVSSASHELKTPVAIIQGYAEGLKLGIDSSSETKDDYCDIILEETKRMNKLIWELLELSKYESGSYVLNRENFDLHSFTADILWSYDILFKERNITVENKTAVGMIANGDASKLEMVFGNYISNAVSHADGEKKIIVDCKELDGKYRISVFNTGENIDETSIDNIWQSFYRADKSHSRSEGRFGLGLSIVKAIQDLHECSYGVENLESGVRFYFDVDKKSDDTEQVVMPS